MQRFLRNSKEYKKQHNITGLENHWCIDEVEVMFGAVNKRTIQWHNLEDHEVKIKYIRNPKHCTLIHNHMVNGLGDKRIAVLLRKNTKKKLINKWEIINGMYFCSTFEKPWINEHG